MTYERDLWDEADIAYQQWKDDRAEDAANARFDAVEAAEREAEILADIAQFEVSDGAR